MKTASALFLAASLSGCISTRYEHIDAKTGAKTTLVRISVLSSAGVGKVDLQRGIMSAYESEQTAAAAAIAESVAGAVAKALIKP